MNEIAFNYGAETRRLRKIIRKIRNKELSRRANAVLLVLEGHSKAEVARLSPCSPLISDPMDDMV